MGSSGWPGPNAYDSLPRRFRRTKYWRKRLEGRDPLSIWLGGDSMTRGNAATTRETSWARLFQKAVQAHYGQTVGNTGFTAHHTYTNAVPDTRPPWATTGSHVAFNGGLTGQADFISGGNTATATANFTGDRVLVYYLKSSITQSLSIVLDGGAPVVIDTLTPGVATSAGWVWDSGAIAGGAHTVVVRPTGAADAIALDGYIAFNGDFAKPIRLFSSADTGVNAFSFTSLSQSIWSAMNTVVRPDLVVLAHARYEQFNVPNPVPPATYKANMQTLIDNFRSVCDPDPTIVLMPMYACGDKPESTFLPYRQAALELSAVNDVEMVDLHELIGWQSASGVNEWTTDQIHPNDRGSRLIADLLADLLIPGP